MRIIITGGAGFLGDRLARSLLSLGELPVTGETLRRIDEIVLVDRVSPQVDLLEDSRVTSVVGDLAELLPTGLLDDSDLVFHLAAVVSSAAEADFDLGMTVNLAATLQLLETCRRQSRPPRLIFASSLAVFGRTSLLPLPDVIEDSTLPTPQSSYGIQKFIGEQLVADYARQGLVPGRTVRLMTVTVRPGVPNAAASGFLSGIVREPMAGVRSVSPVPPGTEVAVLSPASTIEGLVRAATATDVEWGPLTALTLPALTVTVGGIVDALSAVAGPEVAALVDWIPDARIAEIVTSWPAKFNSERAKSLGLEADPDFESVIRSYLDDLDRARALSTTRDEDQR
ncbi:D-erythronate dehydrogenase [Lacisediminihabitans profunda]|uniref:NAD-dependent epimerase/dehydratase family protein n=1 Tax=Lacisediminihabitans profunda TaxID=2594790 RepID=A0A5C8URL1_9MICO|nr:D-erythronate dehydrogenase [Lacisediminihabitans profunda]TXN30932.1 NAD-dependent epimerase/dehydratase family protein [Lacisediminihabitans profunda]